MNILYICPDDPRLTDMGSRQRTNCLWRALGNVGTVYSLCLTLGDSKETICERDRIAWSSARSGACLGTFWQRVFTKIFKPAVWPMHRKALALSRLPIEWSDVKFDAVVTRYVWTSAIIGAWNIAPCYIDIDDVPLQVYNTLLRGRTPLGSRHIKGWVIGWYQRFVLSHCSACWVPDCSQIELFSRNARCTELKNLAVDPSPTFCVEANSQNPRYVMSVGLLDYAPNVEGIDWFLKEIWPSVHAKWPNIEYLVCGGRLAAKKKEEWMNIPGVRVLGFVEDLDSIYQKSVAVIAPITKGAGTCIKVIEASIRGRKVLATKFAVRGISKDDAEALDIGIFSCEKDFMRQFEAWLMLSSDDRLRIQAQTQNSAKRIWSYDDFLETVKSSLQM